MKHKNNSPLIVGAVTAIALSFGAGMFTQKAVSKPNNKITESQTQTTQDAQPFGGGMGRSGRNFGQPPTTGTVTSVSATAISIKTDQGTTVTATISAETTVSKDRATAARISDISTGNTVAIIGQAGTDGTIAAQRIIIDPQIGGGAGAQPPANAP